MDILLDTHILLWFITGDKKLTPKQLKQITTIENKCFVSIASIWEVAIKLSLNKLDIKGGFSSIEDFFKNPTSALVTVKCFPWHKNNVALMGDAAHAIVPFFGQGMNCGFEDCRVLNQLITKHEHNWNNILNEYQQLRKPDGDAIATLALYNFIEMRDKVADPVFLLQKKIEAQFSSKHPEKWTPAYSLVTFSPNVRYSEALSRGNHQQAIMDEIMQLPDIASKWDSDEIEQLMLKKITA